MADLDKQEKGGGMIKGGGVGVAGRDGGAAAEEEMERFMEPEGISVLDFDLLCSTVALQTQGKWRKLESDEGGDLDNEYGGVVLRMWEGDVMDCFEDRRVFVESACCPCYRFGKNMRRASLGSCFIQGTVHMILVVGLLFNIAAFAVTKRHYYLYFALAFILLVGSYLGFFRMQIRRKFNIRGADSFLEDCVSHLICPCCTLSQESRTLEMNNVHGGIWHGRGDTLCIGTYPEGKALLELGSPPVISTMSSEPLNRQQTIYNIEQNPPPQVVGSNLYMDCSASSSSSSLSAVL
ncbi:PREDICTED: uncharacterized protein LOC104818970 [Tarenaya hassleriana]|uniref:uncharacterized protein LOC104818970 n=1 Tax=Tarenaya hassleriana TaxID=28532 RepID=UPI00053C20A6|nr:PREDICTED: uncharacterized protein LOC104818970 [Tarenaya hassleriana]